METPTSSILQDRFGLSALRPVQREVIERVMGGGDALAVMPTGSGKSLCYQLPALALPGPGIGLVFSPLIALMEDQVAALERRGIRAVYINSTLRRAEREKRYSAIADGAYELVYATPERMGKPPFVEALGTVPGGVKLLAVDEAHCISKWGHDLRPAYREVGAFRKRLGEPVTIALTATATRTVREDIVATLGREPATMPLFWAPIDRPNLSLDVREVWGDDDKISSVREIAATMPGTGIAYFALIRDLDHIATRLRRELPGRSIEVYHGRLDPKQKKRISRRFTEASADDNLLLLATNAFGMGVDKPDIRFIIHAQVPSSVEAYWQEVGRAGRDGEPSRCVLLYDQSDLAIQQQFVEWQNPSADLLVQCAVAIEHSDHADVDLEELHLEVIGKRRGDLRGQLEYTLIELEKLGVIEPSFTMGRYRYVRPLDDAELDIEDMAAKKQRDLRRLLDVVSLTRCEDVRAFVLEYFELT